MELSEKELVHDWNVFAGAPRPARPKVDLNDETLRDGLQSPSVRTPTIEQKLEILHGLEAMGIDALDIGLPGAGPHVVADVLRLAREIAGQRMRIAPNCAARTLAADIRPVVEISQKAGIAIEVACFLGSSPIRQYAEGWEMERLLALTRDAVSLAVGEGLPVMYVTEDTTRARPADAEALYTAAMQLAMARPRSLWPCQSIATSSPVASTTSRRKPTSARVPRGVAWPTVSAMQMRRAPASIAAV